MVRLTDRPDMISAVDHGRKAINQTNIKYSDEAQMKRF